MASYAPSTRQRIADIRLGLRVDRAAQAIPVTTDVLFTVTGGRIALLGLIGEITSLFDATATTLLVTCNADTGADTVLSIASAALNDREAGVCVALPATAGTGLIDSVTEGAVILGANPVWAVAAGSIDITVGGGANAGLMKWTLFYVPIDSGAYVTAA